MNEPEKNFRIVGLKSTNIKRIKCVEIRPTGTTVTVGGANDAGKSSLLDSIFYAIGGQGTVCERPLREGTSKGEIVVDLDDMVVTKTFKLNAAPSLRITMKDGTNVSSPQTILDRLCAKLTFDPLDFTRMRAEKQVETLRQLVGLDFTKINADRKRLYDERTEVNRRMEEQRARLKNLPQHGDAPSTEVSVAMLVADLQKAQTVNTGNGNIRAAVGILAGNIAEQARAIEMTKDAITDLELKLAEAREKLKSQEAHHANEGARHAENKKAADALVDEDTVAIENQITEADGINAKIRDNRAHKEASDSIAMLSKESDAKSGAITRLDEEKEKLLSDAKFPLAGLSFSESDVLLNGVPFTQAGKGKQILASCAIARALNPRLRVILIRDANVIDDANWAIIEKDAEATGFQIWREIVVSTPDEESRCTLVLEDGAIKEAKP